MKPILAPVDPARGKGTGFRFLLLPGASIGKVHREDIDNFRLARYISQKKSLQSFFTNNSIVMLRLT